jgi:hypothetical protein
MEVGNGMRKKWLALVICGLSVLVVRNMPAAEKNRNWQTGQIVESKTTVGPQVHTIAANGKNYLVRGSFENDEQEPAVGASVRFAVEGKSMYISTPGKEYRLYVLGETVAAPRDRALPPPPVPQPVAQQPVAPAPAVPRPVVTQPQTPPPPIVADKPVPVAPDKLAAPASPVAVTSIALDNDAIVKMIVGGLKEDTVVSVIEARPGKYTLTRDALLALRAAGVPQSVITAMSAKMKAAR